MTALLSSKDPSVRPAACHLPRKSGGGENRLPYATASYQVDHGQQDHGAEQRPQEGFQGEALVDVALAEHQAGDDRADDADHDVQQDALLGVRAHDQAREPAHDATDDQPDLDKKGVFTAKAKRLFGGWRGRVHYKIVRIIVRILRSHACI